MGSASATVIGVIIACIFVFVIVAGWLLAEFKGMKEEIREKLGINNETIKMQLHAYERLTLFAERAGLKSLVSRVTDFGLPISVLQETLIASIQSEYEYNLSQQVYVHAEIWKAITQLKDQNIYIIHQIAAMMPTSASGLDFCKGILEYASNENAELNQFVLRAIREESKKLL